MNEGGATNAKFFGVRPRVISLEGASKYGFEFAVVVEPNDWERAVREESESLSDRERAYREFYQQLVEVYAEENPNWYQLTAQPQSWLSFGAGISGVKFGWAFHVQGGRDFVVELYVDTGDGKQNEEIYQTLKQDRDEIETELEGVNWQPLPERRACRIEVATPVSDPIEDMDEERKQELIEWGVQKMDEVRAVFESRLQQV